MSSRVPSSWRLVALCLAVHSAAAFKLAPARRARPAATCAAAHHQAARAGLCVLLDDEGAADGPSGLTQEQRQAYMDMVNLGVGDGGWDNDEYLARTKTAPVTSDMELLIQAEAYVSLLTDRGMPLPPDRVELIEGLRKGLSAEELATVAQRVAANAAEAEAKAAARELAEKDAPSWADAG